MKANSRSQVAYLAKFHPKKFKKVENKEKFLPKKKKKGGQTKSASAFMQALVPDYFPSFESNQSKHAFVAIEDYDHMNSGYQKETLNVKTNVNYRQGSKPYTCEGCVSYNGGDCSKVEGTVNSEATCDLFESETVKKASAVIGYNHGHIFNDYQNSDIALKRDMHRIRQNRQGFLAEEERKFAQAGGSMGANLASMLDGEIEENKKLREQVAQLRGALEAAKRLEEQSQQMPSTDGMGMSPQVGVAAEMEQTLEDTDPMNDPLQSLPQQQGEAPTGPTPNQGGQPIEAPQTMQQPNVPVAAAGVGKPVDMTGEAQPGMPLPIQQVGPEKEMGMPMNPVPAQAQPGQGQGAMQFMAPAAAMIDPAVVQQEAAQQMEGQQMQMQQQQQATQMAADLEAAEAELQKNKKTIERLKDENRALHHAVEPDDLHGNAKKMYDRAGTLPSNSMEIPSQAAPEKSLDKDDLSKLIAEAFSPSGQA